MKGTISIYPLFIMSTKIQNRFSIRILFLGENEGVWNQDEDGLYNFAALVFNDDDAAELKAAVQAIQETIPYIDDNDERVTVFDTEAYGYMGEDERQWNKAKVQNFGRDPILNPKSGRYFRPYPMNKAISEGDNDYIYFSQFDPARVTGLTAGSSVKDYTATARVRFQVVEHTGAIHAVCDYLDFDLKLS
jgi:hypothetical protein